MAKRSQHFFQILAAFMPCFFQTDLSAQSKVPECKMWKDLLAGIIAKSVSWLQRNYTSGLGSVEISQHLSLTTLILRDARILVNGRKTI